MSLGKHTAFNLAGSAVPIIAGLITVPLYLKAIGPDRYGVLAIAWLLLGYFGLFDLGLGRATTYRIASLKDSATADTARVLWTAIIVNIAMGLFGALALWLASSYFFTFAFKVPEHLRGEMIMSAPLLALCVPVATLTGVLTGALQARERFYEVNLTSTISTVLFQFLPLIVAWTMEVNLVYLLAAALLARAIAIVMLWMQCKAHVLGGSLRPTFARSEVGLLLKYGGWVTVTGMLGPLLVIVDRFAIGAILGATAVTIYSVPFQLAQRLTILPNALVTAIFPRLPSATSEEREVFRQRAMRVLVPTVTPPVLIGIFALFPFMDVWIGPQLGQQAAAVGVFILLGYWANSLGIFAYVAMQARGRPDLVSKLLILEIPPYLICLYLFMNYFGIMGCAAIFAIRCAVDSILMTVLSFKKINIDKDILVSAAFITIAFACVFTLSYTSLYWWLSLFLVSTVSSIYFWRVAPYELKNIVFGALRMFNRGRGAA